VTTQRRKVKASVIYLPILAGETGQKEKLKTSVYSFVMRPLGNSHLSH